MPRFVKEYANYKIDWIKNNEYMNPGIKTEILKRIGNTVEMLKKGMITIDECMRLLSMDCMREWENMEDYMV